VFAASREILDERIIKLFIQVVENALLTVKNMLYSLNGFDTVNSQGWPCHVSFDHDLGEAVPSGMDFAHYLVEKSLDEIDSGGQGLPKSFEYRVHSANPIGAENIQALLQRYLQLIRQV